MIRGLKSKDTDFASLFLAVSGVDSVQHSELYVLRAKAKFGLKNFEACILDCDTAISLYTRNAEAYFGRGIAYGSLKNIKKCMLDLNKALEINPNNPIYYASRAKARDEAKEFLLAIEDINKSINIDPDNYKHYIFKAKALVAINKFKESIDDCNKALKLKPKEREAITIRGIANYALKNYNGAIIDFDHLIKSNQNISLENYVLRGEIYIHINQFNKALEDFNFVLNKNPNNFKAHKFKAKALIELGHYNEAERDCRLACQIAIDAELYEIRAKIEQYQKNYKQAIIDLEQAIKLRPEEIKYKTQLYKLYWSNKEYLRSVTLFWKIHKVHILTMLLFISLLLSRKKIKQFIKYGKDKI